nr:hypothetical protein [Tanacetum cinerariifolium]
MEKIFDVMSCEDAFKTRLDVYKFEGNALAWWKAYKQAQGGDVWLITERLKREYHSIRQTDTETSTEFMQHFRRLAGFLGAAAGTAKEQAKNFQWGLRRSTLNHLMCMPFTDVAQVANAARNYEILHERDDDDTGEAVVTTIAAATTTTLATTTRIPVIGVTRETRVSSPTDLSILVFSSLGVSLRGTPTRSALRVDADTQESVVKLLADKKPGASGHVFTITKYHATKTSGTITDTLFIYGHAVFVLFDTGATHSVISFVFALRVTMTPTLLDHVLCISTPMKDSVRITHVYRDLMLQFDDKIRAINGLPLDMYHFRFASTYFTVSWL